MKKKKLLKKITLSKETVSNLDNFSKFSIRGGYIGNGDTAVPCNTIGLCETDGQNYCFPQTIEKTCVLC